MSATLHESYRLARLGYAVAAGYAPTADGCNCDNPACDKPGKHPRGGYTTSTTDTRTIATWPKKYRADFNTGFDLGKSGIVAVSSDSPEWEAEFARRGNPSTVRYQSGGGAGHTYALYRRTPDCPQTRICVSGEYDIMSEGYAVAPPSRNGKGPYVWLTDELPRPENLPDAEPWVVRMLQEKAAEEAAKKTPRTGDQVAPDAPDDGDDPPCPLSAHDLATWQGKYPKRKPDGSIDRSATLLKIGRVLYDAEVGRRWIVTALRDRDHQLAYHKYCCTRADAETQYGAIVDKLEAKGRSSRIIFGRDAQPDGGDDGSTADAAETTDSPCRDQLAVVRAENTTLKRTLSAIMAVVRNEGLTPAERIAGVVTAFHVVEGRRARKADDEGAVPAFVPKIAERAGMPERTYSRTLKNLETYGWAERRHPTVQAWDPTTQQYTSTKVTQLRVILPGETVAEALAPLAAIKPERIRAGGARPRQCARHPEADVYSRTTWHCGVCHERIDRELSVDEETGEVFGDLRPEAGQNGGPDEPTPQGLLFEVDQVLRPRPEPAPSTETGGQNGSLTTGGLDGQIGGPQALSTGGQNGRPSLRSQPTPELCTGCGRRPPVPYRQQCQTCIVAALPEKQRAS